MDMKAQRASFFLLCFIGVSIPYLVLIIDFQTESYNTLHTTPWARNSLRFIAVSDAIDEIWKIILPLATTVLAADYLQSKRTKEQVLIFFLFFLTYVVANYSVVTIQDETVLKKITTTLTEDIGRNLSSVLLGVGQYCITIAVLMLGLKSTNVVASQTMKKEIFDAIREASSVENKK